MKKFNKIMENFNSVVISLEELADTNLVTKEKIEDKVNKLQVKISNCTEERQASLNVAKKLKELYEREIY